jgi:putative DNA methylase
LNDARVAAHLPAEGILANDSSAETKAYADAIATYLGMSVSKLANRCSTICFWDTMGENVQQVFARQAIPMTWDFTEGNPFSDSTGNFLGQLHYTTQVIEANSFTVQALGKVEQRDATHLVNGNKSFLISTDPPYYDNIGYADLSDFFYIWLRRSLNIVYPDLFATMLVPKAQELVATPYRFEGDKSKAQHFFEEGLNKVFTRLCEIQNSAYPMTVYYAFKQVETEVNEDAVENKDEFVASTGWETMLEGLIKSGFTITGTWPIRTELTGNLKKNMAALASSIIIVCRPRPIDAPIASRRQFLNALRAELPSALKTLQHGSIAPVDLAQASIGPGMAIYSRYSKVVESDGTPLRVRTALQLINRALDEALAEQEGEYDPETRWAVAWFEQYSMNAGEYGIAETLSKAKNTTVQSLVDARFLEARAGKVRLLKREELPKIWNPKASRLTVWEVMQRMIDALLNGNGEVGAGHILRQASAQGEGARDLAYRLYTVCERKGWAQEALAYNSLVTSWSEISRLAHREADGGLVQATFLG